MQSEKEGANDKYIQNSANSQAAMWKVIKNINPNLHSPNTDSINAKSFNNFFTNIAEDAIKNLPTADKHFTDYINGNDLLIDFEFKEVSYNEVRDIISELKNITSKDPYDINVQIIKTLKNIIVYPPTNLINQCIRDKTGLPGRSKPDAKRPQMVSLPPRGQRKSERASTRLWHRRRGHKNLGDEIDEDTLHLPISRPQGENGKNPPKRQSQEPPQNGRKQRLERLSHPRGLTPPLQLQKTIIHQEWKSLPL